MKWGGYDAGTEQRFNSMMKRLFSGKMLGALLTLSALGLILGANAKWNP